VRSTDGGEHWERALSDPGAAYQASAIEQGFAAVRAAGPWNKCDAIEAILLRTSTDGGKTWQRMDEGLAVAEGTYVFEKATSPITAISDFEQLGKYLFCSHQTGISRSADGGKTWQLVLPAPVSGKPWVFELSKSGQTIVAALRWGGC
jgi:photosystem II stability/assembly factor-like uncharacterized protein